MTAALGLQIVDAKMRYSQELASGGGGRGRQQSMGGMEGMKGKKGTEV